MNIADLIRAFFTTAGPGGVFVLVVIVVAGTLYVMLTRWILAGSEVEEALSYKEIQARRREERRRRWETRRRRRTL